MLLAYSERTKQPISNLQVPAEDLELAILLHTHYTALTLRYHKTMINDDSYPKIFYIFTFEVLLSEFAPCVLVLSDILQACLVDMS